MNKSNNKHLSLDDRLIIEKGLSNGSSKTAIAKTLGKHKSTISREVAQRRKLYTSKFRDRNISRDCTNLDNCSNSFGSYCKSMCSNYSMSLCKRRDKSIGVCNGCSSFQTCIKTKFVYDPVKAHEDYRNDLVEFRSGVDLSSSEAKLLGDLIKPLIEQGHSLYSIVKNNPSIDKSERTLYNYITDGVFSQSGLYDIDLRRKVSRKLPKSKIISKPRESRAYLKGRCFSDFELFVHNNPYKNIVEMDTVYNDISNGPFIQTFFIVKLKIFISLYHNHLSAQSMLNGIRYIKVCLGDILFNKLFGVIITDRGAEFSLADDIESLGTNIFYCDPMASHQKPNIENSHVLLRYILPKSTNLTDLGLISQSDLDLINSHINSYPRESLNGKSPIDVLEFFYPKNTDILDKLNISKIDHNVIVLQPYLIKKVKK
jgi:IS30 family transposase